MSNPNESNQSRTSDAESGNSQEFVTFTIAGQLFGIPVLQVHDVLSSYHITPIPLKTGT